MALSVETLEAMPSAGGSQFRSVASIMRADWRNGANDTHSVHRLRGGKKLSVVVPCYNEAGNLLELVRRLGAICSGCVGEDYELVLVNDGSVDDTWGEILRLAEAHQQIVGVDLARNHGHQLALTAGLTVAVGSRILIIDADLQDPPELLLRMMAQLDAGADVAYGQRLRRKGETWFKRASAAIFYRLLRRLADVPIPADTGDFRLMTREVLDVLLAMPEQHRFIRGMIAWIGFRQVPVPYERSPRFAGATKYSLRKMISFAIDAITGFSAAPLRLSLYFSFGTVLVSFLLASYTFAIWLSGEAVPGWSSIAIILLAFGGMQMFCLGIMGEYLGRIYTQSKDRPLFIIRSIHQNEAIEDDREIAHGS